MKKSLKSNFLRSVKPSKKHSKFKLYSDRDNANQMALEVVLKAATRANFCRYHRKKLCPEWGSYGDFRHAGDKAAILDNVKQ